MIGFGFTHRAHVDLPVWAHTLTNLYWTVRVEARNASKRRKYYRYIRKERLRLVEAGISANEVDVVCKYLVSLKKINAERVRTEFTAKSKQLFFVF